ncbi:MAG: hypothetical protein ABIB65_01495 [Candidatus Margulisiibacteriota bacterium]
MSLENESDKTLYNLVGQKENSPDKQEAKDILEKRRLKPVADAAKESADAAKESADAAKRSARASLIMAFIALASLCLSFYLVFFKAK